MEPAGSESTSMPLTALWRSATEWKSRGERGMSSRSAAWNVCMRERERERNRCCLYSQCVRAARSLCQICIMRGVSLLQCMLLRGLPAVASSRSLFTNAFLFSSSSWLGIRPALPPSMWQACYQHTARAVKAVSNYLQSSGEVLRPFHVFYILCCSLITLIVSSVAQNDRENRILAIDDEEKLKSIQVLWRLNLSEDHLFVSIMSLRSD